ncbi:hypothetical protein MMC21_007306 [Puttea exsequens]|nr:hypothetical protein [Puttea exsequens]
MAPQEERPYVLLSDQLPSMWVAKLLGRIVADPRYPSDAFAPKRVKSGFMDEIVEVVDTNVQITLHTNQESELQAKLERLLGLQKSLSSGNEATFNSKRAVTRSLELHKDVWEKVYSQYKQEVDELLASRDCKGVAYMVVAVKTIMDAEVEAQRGYNQAVVINAEVPISQITTAALMGSGVPAPPVPDNISPMIQVEKKLSADWLQRNVAEGERIFAIRCRVIRSRKKWVPWAENKPAEYGQMHRVAPAHGIFGASEEDADVEIEPEESDEATEDTIELLDESVRLPSQDNLTFIS